MKCQIFSDMMDGFRQTGNACCNLRSSLMKTPAFIENLKGPTGMVQIYHAVQHSTVHSGTVPVLYCYGSEVYHKKDQWLFKGKSFCLRFSSTKKSKPITQCTVHSVVQKLSKTSQKAIFRTTHMSVKVIVGADKTSDRKYSALLHRNKRETVSTAQTISAKHTNSTGSLLTTRRD